MDAWTCPCPQALHNTPCRARAPLPPSSIHIIHSFIHSFIHPSIHPTDPTHQNDHHHQTTTPTKQDPDVVLSFLAKGRLARVVDGDTDWGWGAVVDYKVWFVWFAVCGVWGLWQEMVNRGVRMLVVGSLSLSIDLHTIPTTHTHP
jgi:hypothetical protein